MTSFGASAPAPALDTLLARGRLRMCCTIKPGQQRHNLYHPSRMILRKRTRKFERFLIAQCYQGLDVSLQAHRAPRRNRTEAALGKIPASESVPSAVGRRIKQPCA